MAKKIRNEAKDLKQFGIALAAILFVFGVVHFMRHRLPMAQWFFGIGTIILITGILTPKALRPIYSIFLKIAHAMGWFNTRVILGVIYFLLVTPIAVIMRMTGNDPIKIRPNKDASTYWIDRPVLKVNKEQLEKQF